LFEAILLKISYYIVNNGNRVQVKNDNKLHLSSFTQIIKGFFTGKKQAIKKPPLQKSGLYHYQHKGLKSLGLG